ncbi:unnamed protein product [Chondrus crispus]|uniref:G-patch domain-containing protein n=1 Tax=Chondrus crispus TaxID=2769 RepID=R7QAR8_CHOCR|nr:unnamed protein product [Chondrus crispus]CDF34550.1 unnamed protein product [Chondrus crispus]|eukprot:XP_005714369.1 unnamed protein product [Chondrus crispus]
MGDTVLDAITSPESSSGNEEPRPSLSRPKSNRVLHNRRSPKGLRRKKRWKRRFASRLKQLSPLYLSSQDVNRTSAASYAALLEAHVQPSSTALAHPRVKDQVREAFRNLPRPSQVVPDLDAGSASDAGFGKDLKESHRRRVKSTEIIIQYLNRDGTQDPVPPWAHDINGLKRYTRYMFPPPEDQNIEAPRVLPAFLSKSYRGSLLRTYKVGARSRRTKNKGNPSKGITNFHDDLPCATSSDPGSVADYEYWATTTDSELEALSPPLIQQTKVLQSANSDLGKSNKELLQEVLAEHASDSSKTENSDSSTSSVPPASSQTPPEPVEELPRQEEGADHLSELFKMVEENPNTLFGAQTVPEEESIDIRREEKSTSEKENRSKKQVRIDHDSNLSPFDKERKKAEEFCNASVVGTRSINIQQVEILKMQTSVTGAKPVELADANMKTNGYDASSKSLRMMQKMGFKGRLGAKEDGILEPIKPRTTDGRLGLGLRSERDVQMGKPAAVFPSKFKGKNAHAPVVDPDKSPVIADDFAKPLAKRKSGPAGLTENAPHSIVDLDGSNHNKRLKRGAVLEVEKYASDQSYVDNGRRAVLIDMDALMRNSLERRLQAFRKLVESVEVLANDFDLSGFLEQQEQDLSDNDYIARLIKAAGLGPSDSLMTRLHDDLDAAYRSGSDPEWNGEVLRTLKQYCKTVSYGLLHRGSRGRMNREMTSLGTAHQFLNRSRVTVKNEDEWPYIMTWQDLLCRIGVRAQQAVLLVRVQQWTSQTCLGGVVASSVLGARSLLLSEADSSVSMELFECNPRCEIISAEVGRNHERLFAQICEKEGGMFTKRNVLALYSSDGLWYAGREEFGGTHGVGKACESSLIAFFGYGKREWVQNDCVLELSKEHYHKMRDARFAGILDPADVEDL